MHKHARTRGVWGHAPPEKVLKLGALEAIFVLKFIFGLNAIRILGMSVFGAPLAMFRDR